MFKQDQEIFNILLGSVSEGVIIVDEQQIIKEVNKSAEHTFGYKRDELIGNHLNLLIPQDYHSNHGAHFKGFMKKHERRRMGKGRDIYGLRKSGEVFPVEAGLNPFNIYGNTYVMALIIDITERKIAEQEKNHLATIFDESLNEIYVFNAKTLQFKNVNYGAQMNIGYSLDELKLMTPIDIKPDYSKAQFLKVIEPLLNKSVEKLKFETNHQRKNGSLYPIEAHLQLSNIGNEVVCVAIILDITERKNYTEKLEQTVAQRTKELRVALEAEKELNELKTKFLSLVSHEFKTPLTGILTSAILLGKYDQTAQQEKRDKHINTITNKVHYLNNILNDFLSIEKLETGKVTYKFENFKISKVLNEVIYSANMLLKEGQKINYPENIDDISLIQDERMVELMLSNLVHNAIKYSPANSHIDVEISQDDQETTFKFKDRGIGISKKDQKNIFNRYFRAENALLTQGTGIGLNIVKTHMENLGGTINFNSKLNEGSTFIVIIPNQAIK